MESHAQAYFSAHFPEAVASIATGLFDVIPAVSSICLARIAGIQPVTTWKLAPRLNIVCGPSGSGKTRVLEALRKRYGTVASLLTSPPPRDFVGMSFGQTVMAVGEILLQIQPPGSCLLMDDVLCSMDRRNTERLLHLLHAHGEQTVLTAKPCQYDAVRAFSQGTATRLFHLNLPSQGGESAAR